MEKVVRQICVDSDVLIELVYGDKEIVEFIQRTDAEWHTTTINLFEIWSERKEKQQNIENLIQGLRKQDFDEACALKAGEIRKQLKEKGVLLIPVGVGIQKMVRVIKEKGRITEESLGDFAFVELQE